MTRIPTQADVLNFALTTLGLTPVPPEDHAPDYADDPNICATCERERERDEVKS